MRMRMKNSFLRNRTWLVLLTFAAANYVDQSIPTTSAHLALAQTPTPSVARQVAPLAVAVAPAVNKDWPGFRGPTGQGLTNAKPPVKWSANENIAWKTKLPGPGASSPVVFGDRIYLTCYTGYFVPGESGGSLEELKRHL